MAQYLDMPEESRIYFMKCLAEQFSPEEARQKWEQLLSIYQKFIEDMPDIGGKKNMMWKSLYGAVACFAWYELFDRKLSEQDLKDVLSGNMTQDTQKKPFLAKLDFNNKAVRGMLHGAFKIVGKKFNQNKASGKWGNTWGIEANPLHHEKGVSMHLVGCPIADFAKSHGYEHLMPIFCGSDYEAIRANFGKELYRTHTVAEGYPDCDYWILNSLDDAKSDG